MTLKDSIIIVTHHGLGTTRPEHDTFGKDMLDKFFHVLEKEQEKPRAICFYTEGVRAVCEGSPHVLGLQLLEKMGVRVVSCVTCLKEYGLEDRVAVGEIGGVPDFVRLMAEADKVITI